MTWRKVLTLSALFGLLSVARADQPNPDDLESIRHVMMGYYAALSRDARTAADYIGEPELVVQKDKFVVLTTHAEVASLLSSQLAQLWVRGYAATKKPELHIKMLNATTALCGTIAIRVRDDGTELERAGFTYLLQKEADTWKIHATMPTDLDKGIAAEKGIPAQ